MKFDTLYKIVRRGGFTLIELLVVIGILGALAAMLLSNIGSDRTETLDASVVQTELADIQRAFQRFYSDCMPIQADLKLMTKYGLAPLMEYDGYLEGGDTWGFDGGWNSAKGKGWRGPYIEREGEIEVDISDTSGVADSPGQPEDAGGSDTAIIPVIFTPYVEDEDGISGDYYRVIYELDGTDVDQLWVVFPSHSGQLPSSPELPGSYQYKRRMLLDD